MIYLDNAATTFPKPESVYNALDRANRQLAFNTGRGGYFSERKATEMMDETRQALRDLVRLKWNADVIFTPSITVALNQILNGIDFIRGDNVYVSPYEHNAIARTIHYLEKKKEIHVIQMPLKKDSLEIDIDKLTYAFSKEPPKCVCCIHVSNVTGYVLPVYDIFKLAKKYEAITVLDTAQSLGLLEVNAEELYVDFVAFAGHKSLYGPFGIGGYINVGKVVLNEFLIGGTGSDSLNLNMPFEGYDRYEPASHNIVAIAGLNAALKELKIGSVFNEEKELLHRAISRLENITRVKLYLPPEEKHIGILAFNIEGYKAEDVGTIFDQDFDIAVRAGYHCAPYIHKWLNDERFLGTVRIGIGRYNTKEDIDTLADAVCELC